MRRDPGRSICCAWRGLTDWVKLEVIGYERSLPLEVAHRGVMVRCADVFTPNDHGTGCTDSATLAVHLGHGHRPAAHVFTHPQEEN